MYIRFVSPGLRDFDELKSEALSIPVFSDERPPRGPLGLVDWRLGGHVSKLMTQGRIQGGANETVLIPTRPRLTFEKLFLFGAGPREDFTPENFDRLVERMLRTLTRARVRASTCVLPGRVGDLMVAEDAMERFLVIARDFPEQDEITLVESTEAQKVMAPLVARDRRRARAQHV